MRRGPHDSSGPPLVADEALTLAPLNLFEAPTESISEAGVLLTLLEGEVVHRAGSP